MAEPSVSLESCWVRVLQNLGANSTVIENFKWLKILEFQTMIYIVAVGLGAILLCYMLIDVAYFGRTLVAYLVSRYCRKSIQFGETSTLYGMGIFTHTHVFIVFNCISMSMPM